MPPPPPTSSLAGAALAPPHDAVTVAGLVASETHFMPLSDYLRRLHDRSVDATARQDSTNWILKVNTHHHFRPETAFLAVTYLDRFLSRHSLLPGWAFQLLAVACLSLAAKMEETTVPLLLDLQLFDPKFVFDPRTVQRMELCVLSTLQWRLRSVTPFDYLHYFIPKPLTGLFSVAADLILSTTRVIDFLAFTPSTIATAAALCAAGESVDIPDTLNREMVRSCHQLMVEYLIDTCPVPEPASTPSPIGVLVAAACRSCKNTGSSRQAEPPTKRLRSSAPDVHEDHR